MLVNCPRCGLSQPLDQYCAQCGVDMQSFKPQKVPTLIKIFRSARVQILILLLAGAYAGQYLVRSDDPKVWAQKISHFQGVSKSKSTSATQSDPQSSTLPSSEEDDSLNSDSFNNQKTESLNNKEFGSVTGSESASGNNVAQNSPNSQSGAQELSALNFKISFIEVSRDVLTKWISESSSLGQYQSLNDYSAGILPDFKKRTETYKQTLKSADLKISPGNSNSVLTGTISSDGNQIIGLVTAVDYKSSENESVHGNIMVTKNNGQSSESYPAEFNLPKGAAFFIIGALKPDNFVNEKNRLIMPPFQIFKSPDFMTRKTEFVIVLEPDYK